MPIPNRVQTERALLSASPSSSRPIDTNIMLAMLEPGADRPAIVRHSGTTAPQTGGQFTDKRYRAERSADGVTRVVLEPANAAFAPIVLTADDADEVRVVAEVVALVSCRGLQSGTSPSSAPYLQRSCTVPAPHQRRDAGLSNSLASSQAPTRGKRARSGALKRPHPQGS